MGFYEIVGGHEPIGKSQAGGKSIFPSFASKGQDPKNPPRNMIAAGKFPQLCHHQGCLLGTVEDWHLGLIFSFCSRWPGKHCQEKS